MAEIQVSEQEQQKYATILKETAVDKVWLERVGQIGFPDLPSSVPLNTVFDDLILVDLQGSELTLSLTNFVNLVSYTELQNMRVHLIVTGYEEEGLYEKAAESIPALKPIIAQLTIEANLSV
uniref:Uncharacterized protein n=1 Tax=Euplotes harpa TaxID=151035 RepID=A0A7S3JJC8_9SPIT|mmetsp:Transcript_42790/g.50169  ORF Transcript_42790/g.50169 Transcript_42790/m.50169 type:complete len:122 (+) Transcript_42790:1162-1527(+)|eukprot:CAMPEP_0168342042 /NCGR_PEP_ID=MMETSP0213-20121227/15106_1 /TAXON_ID=151035 /ORGANISM="Euplotes harpa, Strain FSP1.4" /LENGTH=121 /DNA_ID=CAMNT_0008348759 /DNA_START=1174 /DNA_END=1539 /DNA_ORIENTATION=-